MSAALYSGAEGTPERQELSSVTESQTGLQLVCSFDPKLLMRGIIEEVENLVFVQQSLWVLSTATWSSRDRVKASNLSIVEAVTRLMNKYPDDEVVTECAFGTLKHITFDSPDNLNRLSSSGCTSIFKAIKKFIMRETLVFSGLSILDPLTENKNNITVENSPIWVDSLLEISNIYNRNPSITATLCRILGHLLPNCSNVLSDAVNTDVAKICLQTLVALKGQSVNSASACAMLAGVSKVPIVQDLIFEAGGYTFLLDMLRECASEANTECGSAAILTCLTSLLTSGENEAENAKTAGDVGAMDVVMKRLASSMQDEAVAENGFYALNCLLLDPDNQADGGSDALELIISGLEVHCKNNVIVRNACLALELLMANEEMQDVVFFSDVMDILVRAMRVTIDPSADATSPANSRTSSSSSIRLGMLNIPPRPVIPDAPLCDPANPAYPPSPPGSNASGIAGSFFTTEATKTLIAACCALSSCMGVKNLERARSAGAGEVLCIMLRKYAMNSDVVENASWAVSRLALTTFGQIQLGNMGAVKIMFDCLEMYKQDQNVTECILYAISNLSFDPNNSTEALSYRAINVFAELLSMYSSVEAIVERTCVALSNVLTVQEDLGIIRECGIIPLIIHALSDFIESPDVVEQGLWALGNIIVDDVANKERAIAEGIKPKLKSIEDKYQGNEDIMIQLRRVKHPVNKVWWLPDFSWIVS